MIEELTPEQWAIINEIYAHCLHEIETMQKYIARYPPNDLDLIMRENEIDEAQRKAVNGKVSVKEVMKLITKWARQARRIAQEEKAPVIEETPEEEKTEEEKTIYEETTFNPFKGLRKE